MNTISVKFFFMIKTSCNPVCLSLHPDYRRFEGEFGQLGVDVSAAQQRLVKIVQGDVYFDDIELLMLDEVADDQIKFAAVA